MKKTFAILIALPLLIAAFLPSASGAAEEPSDFEYLRERWANFRVPNHAIDMDNPVIRQKIEALIAEAETIWETMETDNPDYLWADLADPRDSWHVTLNYRNLRTLAEVYALEVSPYYQNEELVRDIIYGLDWMDEHRYNNQGIDYGNWWDFQIGAPLALNDTVILVYDHLTPEQIERYASAVRTFVPDPTRYYATPDQGNWELKAEGANLLDLIKVVVGQGIYAQEEERILQGTDAFPTVEFLTSGTGMGLYFDGSFVDHYNIPYNGTYGNVMLGNLYDIPYLLSGSTYAIDEEKFANTYEMIIRSFEPLIYRGLMMDMVNGRSITREASQNIGAGIEAVENILLYSDIAPPEYKDRLQSMVKEWLLTGVPEIVERFRSYPAIRLAKQLLEDDSIAPRGDLIGHFHFANMARVVHHRPGYAFGISMYSNRIGAYEGNMNGENLKGHYTGSGMTYLYNDLYQYNDHFWATVDMTRLPGITTDPSKPLTVGLGTGKTSPQAWVGGSTIHGLYGVAGMYLDQSAAFGQDLKGKKSWFMFDDEIVALGADLRSSNAPGVETIVENRMIRHDGSNAFVINGEEMPVELGWEHQESQVLWAHLEGNVENTDIGYVFPEGSEVHFKRIARTGSWRDVTSNGSEEAVTRNYLQIIIDHGAQPDGETYQYVLLPLQSAEQTARYAQSPDIEVLANNERVQAVKEHTLNLMGANFWEPGETTVDRITSFHQASVMMEETADERLVLSVSDPTHEQDEIELILHYRLEPIEVDERVQIVEQTLESTTLAIRVDGAMGASIRSEFRMLPQQAAGMLEEFNEVVTEGIESGKIRGPLINQLRNPLDQAIRHEAGGRLLQAANAMENFLMHLNRPANSGHVDEEMKADLQLRAEQMIYVLLIEHSGPEYKEPKPEDPSPGWDEPDKVPVMIRNASFEEPAENGEIPGWVVERVQSYATYALSTERAYDGDASLMLEDTSTNQAVIVRSESIPVVPGIEYTASMKLFLETGRCLAIFNIYNAAGETVSKNEAYIETGHGDWQTVTFDVYVPEDAAYAQFRAMISSYWMGKVFYDDFELWSNDVKPAPEVLGITHPWHTSSSAPVLTLKGVPDSTIYVYEGDQVIASAAATGEVQMLQLPELSEGEHLLIIHAVFDEDTVSWDRKLTIVIDTTPPEAPVVLSPTKPLATSDRTPELRFAAEPGTTVIVKEGERIVSTGSVDESGEVAVVTKLLDKGTHHLTVVAVDRAGNESPVTELPPIIIHNGNH